MRAIPAIIVAALGVFGGPIAAQVAVEHVETSAVFRTALSDIEETFRKVEGFLDDALKR